MAKPFVPAPSLLTLPIPFPGPDALKAALIGGTRRSRETVVRLWLTEGFPAAFRECSAVYEDLRGWLGARLGIHPKEITLVGSARIGYSLAAPPQYGKPFGEHSDLDLVVVSGSLFGQMVGAFELFVEDYKSGAVTPRNASENAHWSEDVKFGERNIPRGFLDASKVPNLDRYPVVQQINDAMWALLRKLDATPGAPRVRRASARVYRDWQSFVDQASLNLSVALKQQANQAQEPTART